MPLRQSPSESIKTGQKYTIACIRNCDEIEVATIPFDETAILEIKATIAWAIPIKFNSVNSRAMTAQKSAKTSAVRWEFLFAVAFVIFSLPSLSSLLFEVAFIVASQRKTNSFYVEILLKNRRFGETCAENEKLAYKFVRLGLFTL